MLVSFNQVTQHQIPPTPDSGPNPHFLEKRASGSKNPHFPSFWKREFSVKKKPFFCKGMGILGPKTPFSSLCKGDGKWGFLDPETLFSRKWGFGPLSGVGGIPTQAIIASGDNELKCSKCYDRKATIAFRTSRCFNR